MFIYKVRNIFVIVNESRLSYGPGLDSGNVYSFVRTLYGGSYEENCTHLYFRVRTAHQTGISVSILEK